jgi:hypothetical protein
MQGFTPLPALLGGALIGLGASVLWLWNGRVAGISGVTGNLLLPGTRDRGWRISFLLGLLLAGAALRVLRPESFSMGPLAPIPLALVAGLLVGFGTRLGNGCTSGHGICGLSRLSARSLVATLTFMLTAALTVLVSRHVLGGAL